jgi:hypothetical protein
MFGVLRRWNLTGFSNEQITEYLVRTQIAPLLHSGSPAIAAVALAGV